ncbi:MAG: hypothetical protein HYV27_02615 [Candidatus Hydrogenedentes bacterium]|nr:hypothetical protein [Candidatus Hydrogenedentota bacterium]
MHLLFVICATLAAPEIWVEPSWVVAQPGAEPSPAATKTVNLYAARGEYESVQICLAARKDAPEPVQVSWKPARDYTLPPPELRLLAPGGTRFEALPEAGLDLSQVQTLWLNLYVPLFQSPGTHTGALELHFAKRKTRSLPVRIEVFDFEIPTMPSLPAYFPLNRQALRNALAIPFEEVERWKPVYERLTGMRFAFNLWDTVDLLAALPPHAEGLKPLHAHLEAFADQIPLPVIDLLGPGGDGARLFPPPLPGVVHDPLQGFLRPFLNAMVAPAWVDRCFAEVEAPESPLAWQETRSAAFRLQRVEERVHRLLYAPPNAEFERYTDWWACEHGRTNYYWLAQLNHGQSLEHVVPLPLYRVNGVERHSTMPGSEVELCVDSSLATAWTEAPQGTDSGDRALTLEFKSVQRIENLNLFWHEDGAPASVEVFTSFNGVDFSSSTVTWNSRTTVNVPDFIVQTTGTLRYPREATAIRLIIHPAIAPGGFRLAEVCLDMIASDSPGEVKAKPVWMDLRDPRYPRLAASPFEARIAPWMCLAFGYGGIRGPVLNGAATPEVPAAPLAVLHEGRLEPGVLLRAFRDGMEDYEYLEAFRKSARPENLSKYRFPKVDLNYLADFDRPAKDRIFDIMQRSANIRRDIGRYFTQSAAHKE